MSHSDLLDVFIESIAKCFSALITVIVRNEENYGGISHYLSISRKLSSSLSSLMDLGRRTFDDNAHLTEKSNDWQGSTLQRRLSWDQNRIDGTFTIIDEAEC